MSKHRFHLSVINDWSNDIPNRFNICIYHWSNWPLRDIMICLWLYWITIFTSVLFSIHIKRLSGGSMSSIHFHLSQALVKYQSEAIQLNRILINCSYYYLVWMFLAFKVSLDLMINHDLLAKGRNTTFGGYKYVKNSNFSCQLS